MSLGIGLSLSKSQASIKTWLENIDPVSAFLDTVETTYAKSRNLWVRLIRDSDAQEMDVGYDATSRATAIAWSAGTDSYFSKRYNEVKGKPDIDISSSSDQELAITGGAWVSHTAKYCLLEPSKSALSVMDIPLSVNARMANKTLASYVIVKDDKPTTLLTSKGFTNDYVYPIKCSAGLMDFGWTNLSNVFWYLAGGTTSTSARPATTLSAGVSYSFGTNVEGSTIELRANNTITRYIGSTKDIPKINNLLDLFNTGTTGTIEDLSSIKYYLRISYTSIIGDLSSLNFTVDNAFLQATNISVSGIFYPGAKTKTIYLGNTNMTPNDTDQTIINLSAITTIVSGGILQVKNNRTAASDAAVASLASKFTITYV